MKNDALVYVILLWSLCFYVYLYVYHFSDLMTMLRVHNKPGCSREMQGPQGFLDAPCLFPISISSRKGDERASIYGERTKKIFHKNTVVVVISCR